MKIALVTTQNANNYGAIFQAFALQQALSRFGDVDIINYDNRHIGISFDLVRVKPTVHGLLGMGKDIVRLVPRYKVIKKFKCFIQNNMVLTKRVSAQELLLGELSQYDAYVAGSDQIWNPACISNNSVIDPIYFLNFAPNKARKLSYASSIGGYQLSIDEKENFKGLLDDFHTISVRERDTQKLLQEVLGKDVHHVLDPTLLLSKEEWLEAVRVKEGQYKEEKYILLYTVPKVSLIRKAVDYFAKKTGLKVVAIDQGISAGANVDRVIRDAGPVDFIQLFANAEFVITDSFHGTCFSLNFGIPFLAISHGVHSNRVESLLSLVGLQHRLVKTEEDFNDLEIIFDYRDANKRLLKARADSLVVLSSALYGV
jgi:hypothetical protein